MQPECYTVCYFVTICHYVIRLVEFATMAARSRNYDVLNEEQKRVLCSFYDAGMKTTGKEMHPKIIQAAEQADLSFERVKVWTI